MYREFKFQWTMHCKHFITYCSVYTGMLVILTLLFLTQLFYYIPKAALAAIIIAAVIYMIEYHVVVPIWKTKSEYISNAQGRGKQNTFERSHNSK